MTSFQTSTSLHTTTLSNNINNNAINNPKANVDELHIPYSPSIEISCDEFTAKLMERKHEENQCREFYKNYEDTDETSNGEMISAVDPFSTSFISHPTKRK
jgi:hypothetical protein